MKVFEQLTIENTTYCGANCVMCVRNKLNFKLANMKQDVFQDAVQKFQEGYLKFGGGFV